MNNYNIGRRPLDPLNGSGNASQPTPQAIPQAIPQAPAVNSDLNQRAIQLIQGGMDPNTVMKAMSIASKLGGQQAPTAVQPSETTIKGVGAAKGAMSLLGSLRETVNDPGQADVFDPMKGTLRKWNPAKGYDTEFQTTQAEINAVKQMVGKYLEGGVLREADERKYEKILPKIGDSRETANAKIESVKEMIRVKAEAELSTLGASNYDVSTLQGEFSGQEEAKPTFQGLTEWVQESPDDPKAQIAGQMIQSGQLTLENFDDFAKGQTEALEQAQQPTEAQPQDTDSQLVAMGYTPAQLQNLTPELKTQIVQSAGGQQVQPEDEKGIFGKAIDNNIQAGIGAVKGGLSTVEGIRQLGEKGLNKIVSPIFGNDIAPAPGIPEELTTPKGTAQKIGFGVEQVGEFFVPGGAALKGAKAVSSATKALKAPKVVKAGLNLAGKSAIGATEIGAVTTAQTGGDADAVKKAIKTGAVLPVVGAVGKSVTKLFSSGAKSTKQQLEAIATKPIKNLIEDYRTKGIDVTALASASNLLKGAVDKTGTITTSGTGGVMEKYTKRFITGLDSKVSTGLKKENLQVPLTDVATSVKNLISSKVSMTGDIGKRTSAKLKKELMALKIDDKGKVSLSQVNDLKIAVGKVAHKSLDTEVNKIGKTITTGLKEYIEKTSKNVKVKSLNKKLSERYAVRDFLKKLNGTKVEGGRLGKMMDGLAGQGVGAMAGGGIGLGVGGGVAGGLGAMAGGIVGKTIGKGVTKRGFKKTFSKTQKAIEKKKAQREALGRAAKTTAAGLINK